MDPVAKALWFIESHFANALTLEEISHVAGISRFHMVRVFGVTTGCSVMRYVRARRLTEAARALANGAPDILMVALDSGYGSHEAFTRAFRDQFGLTPDRVRSAGTVENLILMEPFNMEKAATTPLQAPRIERGPTLLIAGLQEHYLFENLAGLPALWQRFRPHLGHVPGQIGGTAYGVCYNTDDTSFDYIAGVEVADFATLSKDYARVRVAERRYSVFTHTEHVSAVRNTFVAIFNHWLPTSGHTPADAPVFERYDQRFDSRTGLGGFEIWVPLRE